MINEKGWIVFDRVMMPKFKVSVEELRNFDVSLRRTLTSLRRTIRDEVREMLIEEIKRAREIGP
jgi:hypothetical protein